jgi:hypothetical protein
MAKTTRPKSSARALLPIHPHAAGLDIGATFHVAAVSPDRDTKPVRTFNSVTGDLHALADWLKSVGVTTIAMESTSVYWVPVFEILEARGFEVLLVNARDTKNVPGRKTDVNDAQWLQQLHEHGLLRASFRPREGIARLRALLRHRERVIEYAASHIQHMQKALMLMNVQLHHVVSDITGLTGMKIVRDIVEGIRDPKTLAKHRDRRCHATVETICKALDGNYRSEHVFALRQALELYEFHNKKVTECDTEIEAALVELNADPERVNAFETGNTGILCRDRDGGRGWLGVRRCGHDGGGDVDDLGGDGVDGDDRGRQRHRGRAVREPFGMGGVRAVERGLARCRDLGDAPKKDIGGREQREA